jgi:hypothetical protein
VVKRRRLKSAAAMGCNCIDERFGPGTSVDALILQRRQQGIVDFRHGRFQGVVDTILLQLLLTQIGVLEGSANLLRGKSQSAIQRLCALLRREVQVAVSDRPGQPIAGLSGCRATTGHSASDRDHGDDGGG